MQLGENLRDRFVMGIRNERLLHVQKLLTEDHNKSLEELFQLGIRRLKLQRESLYGEWRRVQRPCSSTDSLVAAFAAGNSRKSSKPASRLGTRNRQSAAFSAVNETPVQKSYKCMRQLIGHIRNVNIYINAYRI